MGQAPKPSDKQMEDLQIKSFPNQKLIFAFLTIILILLIGAAVVTLRSHFMGGSTPFPLPTPKPSTNLSVKTFSSEADFKDYLQTGNAQGSANFGLPVMSPLSQAVSPQTDLGTANNSASSENNTQINRVSETNIQVLGIDEPDIVKTDGSEIYFSSQTQGPIFYNSPNHGQKILGNSIDRPVFNSLGKVRVIQALPIDNLSEISSLNKSGNLLLDNKVLVVISQNSLTGFDISDPKNPKSVWLYDFKNNTSVVTAREYQDKLYLVTSSYIDSATPCPYIPISSQTGDLAIACPLIYHPIQPASISTSYTVLTFDLTSGQVLEKLAFVGTPQSVVYMSENNLYLTYSLNKSYDQFLYQFFLDQGSDLLPPELISHLEGVAKLDISESAKETELQFILNKYQSNLDSDQALKYQTDLQNRLRNYAQAHIRDLVRSGVVKIDLNGLKLKSTSEIPGNPLNQFSLDEYQGNLRVATNLNSGLLRINGTTNDLYILDSNLNILGSILDIKTGEQIYSARFVKERGYLVTFKQTDPFFIVDLSDPIHPTLKGELELPGFSSYLHPLPNGQILGIGQEGTGVKLSLFDVSALQNPKQMDKYIISDSYSQISNNHNAFLLDDKHSIFFLPGSSGGYIFSYTNNKFTLETATDLPNVQRAVFINDNLYLISDQKMVVLDENTFKTVKTLSLD